MLNVIKFMIIQIKQSNRRPIIKSYIGEDGYYYNSKPTCESVNGEGSCSSVQYGENDFTFNIKVLYIFIFISKLDIYY